MNGSSKVKLTLIYVLVRLGSDVSGVLSTCCNLHLWVAAVFELELSAERSIHARMTTGLRSLMLAKVLGLLFLILAI